MIKAIIFDCFGVIITDALQGLLDEHAHKDPGAAAEAVRTIHASNQGALRSEDAHKIIADLLGITPEEYRRKLDAAEVKNEQLLQCIEALRANYKTALLSNVSEQGLHRRFTDEELTRYFDTAVASGAIGHAKPDPLAYTITTDRLDLEPNECVFIDDREEYCNGAAAVGMIAVQYKGVTPLIAELERLGVSA